MGRAVGAGRGRRALAGLPGRVPAPPRWRPPASCRTGSTTGPTSRRCARSGCGRCSRPSPPARCSRDCIPATSWWSTSSSTAPQGRADTFHDHFDDGPQHVSLADPYDARAARRSFVDVGRAEGDAMHDGGTVVVVNGPRFSTRAESELVQPHGLGPGEHDPVPRGGAGPRSRALPYAGLRSSPTTTPASPSVTRRRAR